MIVGALFVGVTQAIAEEPVPCWECNSANPRRCAEVAPGVQGMTQCGDFVSCSVWGFNCKDGKILPDEN
jgi:hypothetical protein